MHIMAQILSSLKLCFVYVAFFNFLEKSGYMLFGKSASDNKQSE